MPANPSQGMLQRIFGQMMPQQPQMPTGPRPIPQEGPQQDYSQMSIMPSWMRNAVGAGMDGAVDMTQGMLGMGDSSHKMNLAGQLIPAGLGIAGMAGKGIGGIGRAIGNNPMTSMGTAQRGLGDASSWGKFGTPGIAGPIMNKGINPSSNFVPPYMSQGTSKLSGPATSLESSMRNMSPTTALSTRTKGGPAGPSDDQLDKLLAKYNFGKKKAS